MALNFRQRGGTIRARAQTPRMQAPVLGNVGAAEVQGEQRGQRQHAAQLQNFRAGNEMVQSQLDRGAQREALRADAEMKRRAAAAKAEEIQYNRRSNVEKREYTRSETERKASLKAASDVQTRETTLASTMAGVYGQLKGKTKDEQRRVLGTWLDTQKNNPNFADLIDDDDYSDLDNNWDALTAHFDSLNSDKSGKSRRPGTSKNAQKWWDPVSQRVVTTSVVDGVIQDTHTNQPVDVGKFETLKTHESGVVEERKQVAKALVAQVKDYAEGASGAANMLGDIRLLKTLGSSAHLGIEGEVAQGMRKIGDFLGFEVDHAAMNSGQAITQLETGLTLYFTERTKGAISDREMALFKAAVPGLTNTEGGFQLMAEVMENSALRKIAMNKFAQKVIAQNGGRTPHDIVSRVTANFIDKPVVPLDKLAKLLGSTMYKDATKSLPPGASYVKTTPRGEVWELSDGSRKLVEKD